MANREPRTEPVGFTVTKAERERIEAAAAAEERSIADHVRRHALLGAREVAA